MKKLLVLVVALALVLSSAAMAVEIDIPRTETFYEAGNAWGRPTSYNIYNTAGAGWPASGGNRMVVYEALYMYNVLTNENEPLLADGPITWEDDYNFTVKIKEAAHWNDGEDLTADDVIWTFESAKMVTVSWSDFWTWCAGIEKVDDLTVRFTLVEEPYNVYKLPSMLGSTSIVPKHIWEPIFEANKNEDGTYNGTAIAEIFGDNPEVDYTGVTDDGESFLVASGPYMPYYYDDTRIIAIRDDNYWGQDPSMFGKLPAPKYLAHQLYADNAAGNLSFANGEIDNSQQFMESVWVLMENMVDEDGNSLVKTYFDDFPYHLGYSMPSLIFNMNRPGLDDYAVRKAIALSLDYEAIGTNAMSGYTEAIVPSLFNTYIYGQYLDTTNEEYMALRWDTTDLDGNIAKANELLDEAGYVDVDGDGMREMPDGSAIEWKAECPQGWSDWNASLEILCESAAKIGLNIVTYFPESSVYTNDQQYGTFDIVMASPQPGGSVANPWNIAYNVLYTASPEGEYTPRNYGRYSNPEIDALIEEAASETDFDTLVEIFTEIDTIYLSELPTVALMYRPQNFHTSYSYYWTGFATAGDGTNTPPMNLTDYAGYKELFMIEPTGRE
jgi:peptide/nickel transport system substrate-binding protein